MRNGRSTDSLPPRRPRSPSPLRSDALPRDTTEIHTFFDPHLCRGGKVTIIHGEFGFRISIGRKREGRRCRITFAQLSPARLRLDHNHLRDARECVESRGESGLWDVLLDSVNSWHALQLPWTLEANPVPFSGWRSFIPNNMTQNERDVPNVVTQPGVGTVPVPGAEVPQIH